MRFLESSAVRRYSQKKEFDFSTMAVSIVLFSKNRLVWIQDFVVLAQACLFVCLFGCCSFYTWSFMSMLFLHHYFCASWSHERYYA
jgi:hypothetical protein